MKPRIKELPRFLMKLYIVNYSLVESAFALSLNVGKRGDSSFRAAAKGFAAASTFAGLQTLSRFLIARRAERSSGFHACDASLLEIWVIYYLQLSILYSKKCI